MWFLKIEHDQSPRWTPSTCRPHALPCEWHPGKAVPWDQIYTSTTATPSVQRVYADLKLISQYHTMPVDTLFQKVAALVRSLQRGYSQHVIWGLLIRSTLASFVKYRFSGSEAGGPTVFGAYLHTRPRCILWSLQYLQVVNRRRVNICDRRQIQNKKQQLLASCCSLGFRSLLIFCQRVLQ